MSSLLDPLLAPVLCGVVAHIACHYYPPASILAYISLLLLPPAVATFASSAPSAFGLFLSFVIYLASLATSITTYRLSPFHPLAKYPGPVLARVSRLWATRHAASGRQNRVSHELFERYGDVVRTGPDHLIMRNVSAIPVVLGPKNPWPKNGRYSILQRDNSPGNLLGLISPSEHSKRRKVWDKAFTPSAIKSYEQPLQARLAQLLGQFDVRVSRPIDFADWMGFMSMDFMGDFAYGRNGIFNSMAHGDDHTGAHRNGVLMLTIAETAGTVPWLRPILIAAFRLLPTGFLSLANAAVDTRIEKGSQFRDLFYYLLNEDGEDMHPPLDKMTLGGEAGLAIIAGSDTTGTALANAMYYLVTHPGCMDRLRAELDQAAGEGAAYDVDIDADKLPELRFLQAVINETLRLQPALPNGAQRMPPSEGGDVIVAGHVVPVGTTVQIPTWSIHRDARYFSPDPDAFWPERWLPSEGSKIAEARGQDFKLVQGAYMPFNYGPGNCVGRSLALHEMRTVLAAIVRRFDVHFAPGFRSEDWLSQLSDHYILVRGKLEVILTKRAPTKESF